MTRDPGELIRRSALFCSSYSNTPVSFFLDLTIDRLVRWKKTIENNLPKGGGTKGGR